MKSWNLMVAVAGLMLLSKAGLAQDVESFIIKPEDVTKASTGLAKDGSAYLEVEFTKQRTSEFTAFTERNLKKKTRLVINEKTISEPLINSKITGGQLVLECKTVEEAAALAKYLMRKTPIQASEAIAPQGGAQPQR